MSDLLFEYKDFYTYLSSKFQTAGDHRGRRRALAQHLNCGSSFVSQVLTHKASFSREQALQVSNFLGHTSEEEEYFMALFDYDRAGSSALKRYQQRVLKNLLDKHNRVISRLKNASVLDEHLHYEYYDSWHFAAIHMSTLMPQIKTTEDISSLLNLDIIRVKQVLAWLTKHGVISNVKGKVQAGRTRVHLESESPQICRHHTNWRMKTLEKLQSPVPSEDLHYSAVLSVSREFKRWFKESILNLLQKAEPVLLKENEETLLHLGIDLYSLENRSY
jgi:uncharacterized protein (TIGR02147 family)